MPCYSLAGQVVNGVFTLFTSTGGNDYSGRQPGTGYPSKAQALDSFALPQSGSWYTGGNGGYSAGPSKVYKINAVTKAVSLLATAPVNSVYRSVSVPPQPRVTAGCAPGTFGSLDPGCAFSCPNTCAACPLGTYKSTFGSSSCTACPAGQYTAQTGSVSAAACTVCAPGFFVVNNSLGVTSCAACPIGTYSATGGATSCTPCRSGTTTAQVGSAVCSICAAGFAGVPSNPSTGSSNGCCPCAAGAFSATPNATACVLCPAGEYSQALSSTSCSVCNAGNFSAPGSSACTACPAGSFTSSAHASTCVLCPAGTYNELLDQTSCTACQAGSVSSAVGAASKSTCAVCGLGFFAELPGLLSCTQCPIGTSTPANGSTSISSCSLCDTAANFVGTGVNSSGCVCASGFYLALATCVQCPAKTAYSPEGSTSPSNCSEALLSSSQAAASFATPLSVGGVVGIVIALFAVGLLVLLVVRRSRAAQARALAVMKKEVETAKAAADAANAFMPETSTLGSGGASGAAAAAVQALDKETLLLPWSELEPDMTFTPLFGGFGVVLRATWRGSKLVALKMPLVAIKYGGLPPRHCSSRKPRASSWRKTAAPTTSLCAFTAS